MIQPIWLQSFLKYQWIDQIRKLPNRLTNYIYFYSGRYVDVFGIQQRLSTLLGFF